MALKEFNRFGLRRDNNLSDLPSPITALNNILSTLVDSGETFISSDILPIQQIYTTNITGSTFSSLDGITVSFTVIIDGLIVNAQNPRVYLPLIKIKNRLDTAYFTTGEPYFYGGDGPSATYYDSNKIVRDPQPLELGKSYVVGSVVLSNNKLYVAGIEAVTNTQLNHTVGTIDGFTYVADYDIEKVFLNSDYDPLTGQNITYSDTFWEQGQFIYGSKVLNSFISLFGGVNWKGFYKPTTSGSTTFYLRTTGASVFKFQNSLFTPSSIPSRYGKVNAGFVNFLNTITQQEITTNNLPYNKNQIDEIVEIYNDPTRQLVEVDLSIPLRIKHGDIVYLDVTEGQVPPQQYRILTHRDFSKPDTSRSESGEYVASFWIEVTEEFNRLNLNADDLPNSSAGLTQSGNYGEEIGEAVDTNGNPIVPFGLLSTVRYMPYERRVLQTHLNSIYHKLNIPQNAFTITGATTFTCDDFYYYHFMINDYIYDYRRRTTESQGVRRWRVTGLNDTTKTVTVALDTGYTSVNVSNYNDQQAYISGSTIVFEDTGGQEIDTTYTSGNLNDSISASAITGDLYFVGYYGELTTRYKYITIPEFMEAYTEYAFDWLYFTKDEDVSPIASKAWILWHRNESSGFRALNYKHLYSENYNFYQIGDFKTFVDNSVLIGGTSREDGIEQRAFGRPQLVEKGDQYNELYTLLPLKSLYNPKENWNQVALSRTSSLSSGSRLIGLSNSTAVEEGNYIIQNSNAGFSTGASIPLRTRIIQTLTDSNSVIVSKSSKSGGSVSSYVLDHRGFVTSGYIEGVSANIYRFYGDASELQLGMNVVAVKDPSRSSYNRITRIEPTISGYTLLTLEQDFANVSNTIQGPFASSSNNSFPNAQYGWFTRTGQVQTNPYTAIRQLVIRWNGVTVLDTSSTSDFPTSGGITLSDGYTYYPDQYYNTTYGWSSDENNAFGIRRELAGGQSLCAIYYDRGVDITKPLASFCTSTGCAQNNYDVNTGEVLTKYISVEIGDGPGVLGLNPRWTEASTTGVYGGGNNPDRVELVNGAAKVKWWSEAFPNQNFENHGEAQFNGGKRYASNCIFAKLTGTNLESALREQGHENLTSDYIPIGFIEALIMIDGDIWNGTTISDPNQLKAHFIIRLANRWQSYTDFDVFADGGQRGKIVDFTKFPSSDFNLEYFGFAPNQSIMLGLAISNLDVSTGAILDSAYTNYVNNINNTDYIDKIHRITTDITLTSTQRAYFQNPDSFSRFNETTQLTEYVLPQGSYFKTLSTTGLLVWFSNFEDLQHTHSLYSYPFDVTQQTPNQLPQSRIVNNAITIYPQDGPVKITSNNWQTDQFRYLHYRRKQYEILPTPIFIEERFPGLRVINQNQQTINVTSFLANTTNRLSVFAFANTTDNKELCCPPLDTSPPFDSSPIGLSTTTNEPDMSIAGLVNVRSITATHPTSKIYSIPSTINGQASNTQLPVNKKLGIVFGGIEYDLLIGDSKPF